MGWKRFFRRRSWDDERAAEIESYIEIETDENIARGMSAKEARQAAMRKFGNPAAVREQIYEWNSIAVLESLLRDLRYACRQLRRAPAFTLFAVLTLAIGIGVNTVMFSAVNEFTAWTLPVEDPDTLRQVTKAPKQRTGPISATALMSFSYAAYLEMQSKATSFSDLICFGRGDGRIVAEAGGDAEPVRTRYVSGNYFRTLGVEPAAGRLITTRDDYPEAAPVVVLSHSYWKKQFGGNTAILDDTILLNDIPFVVAGVMPHGFRSEMPGWGSDLTIPIQQLERVENRDSRLTAPRDWNTCQVMGRLRADANEETARRELESIAGAAFAANPPDEPNGEITVFLRSIGGIGLTSFISSPEELAMFLPALLFMLGVAAVLLIACANLAGLLLARGEARKHEIATRISLGAGRARVLRQLLTENVLLAILGGVLGLAFAYALETVWNAQVAYELDIVLSPRVFAFAAGLSILTGILFGMAPALTITRPDLDPVLKRSSRASSGVRKGRTLISVQIALCATLLICSGVLLMSAAAGRNTPLGYEPYGLLTINVDASRTGYGPERIQSYLDDSMKRLQRIPEVTSATLNRYWAWVGGGGYGACIGNDKNVGLEEVGPRFVETMKMRILAGRDLEVQDAVGNRNVLVNESLARQYYSDGNALGQPIALQDCGSSQETGTIVGIVADAKLSPSARLTPTTFAPFRAREKDSAVLVVRFAGDAETLTPTLRHVLRDADRRVSVHSFTRQSDRLNTFIFEELILPGVLLFCGATALLLASIGIYGTLSYSAQRRKTEIGVRVALGALPSRIVRHIVWELLLPVMTGLAAGGLLAVAVIQILRSMLIGITGDLRLAAFITAASIIAISGLAAFVPAWKASRLSPLEALRHD